MALDQPSLPTICVVTYALDKASETFIRSHVRRLNGGNTVAMALRRGGEESLGKPLLVWPRPSRFRRLFGRLDRRPLLPGLPPDPFAAEFEAFVRKYGVGFMLAEFGTLGVEVFELAKEAGIPMFCYFRGFDASRKLKEARYRRNLRRMFDQIDGVVAVSAFLLERLASYGLTHPNTLVIPSGIDIDLFSPAEKDPGLVLSVGRLVAKKSPLTTIRAFARAAQRHAALRLEVIGDGPLLDDALAEARALGVADRVQFHGAKDHRFVAERMNRASIFMQHSVVSSDSDTEGLPTSIQEAMAAGAAVISTRHAGIPEIIAEGRTGILVDELDENGYEAALDRLASDPDLRIRLSNAARELAVQQLDYTKLYGRLEGAMSQAIATRNAAAAP